MKKLYGGYNFFTLHSIVFVKKLATIAKECCVTDIRLLVSTLYEAYCNNLQWLRLFTVFYAGPSISFKLTTVKQTSL